MTLRGTAALLGLLLALLAWVWRVELPPPAPILTAPAVLLGEPLERVGRVELIAETGTITATKVSSEWLDQRGSAWPTSAVDDLLQTLSTLRPLRTVPPEPGETDRYGIGQRRLRALRFDGAVVLDLQLGKTNPTQTALYAQATGGPDILLIGAVLEWELAKLQNRDPGRDP